VLDDPSFPGKAFRYQLEANRTWLGGQNSGKGEACTDVKLVRMWAWHEAEDQYEHTLLRLNPPPLVFVVCNVPVVLPASTVLAPDASKLEILGSGFSDDTRFRFASGPSEDGYSVATNGAGTRAVLSCRPSCAWRAGPLVVTAILFEDGWIELDKNRQVQVAWITRNSDEAVAVKTAIA